ncbi:type IV secretion system protein [Aggregatibacter kilianii]|uniref:type IV secretion system protein n=1 Tax=Aggregatibacter kilianii TaxID=2025884 RepID=UPI000D68B241|nr:type IV secretion system protein [Aggregatibacter kilianii]
MSFIIQVYDEVTKGFDSNVATYAKSIGSTIKPLVAACFALYILYIIYRMYSRKDAIYAEFYNMLGAFAIIGLFTYAGNGYYDTIIPFVKNAGDQIASALNGNAGSATTTVDTVYNAFQKGIDQVFTELEADQGTFDKISAYFKYAAPLVLLWLSQLVFSVVIVVNLLIAKVMVSLLLSIGIIFFVFACFPATRSMFQSWSGLALNYIILNLLYAVAAKLAGDLFLKHLADPNELIAKCGVLFISTVIIALALNQIPTLSSSLTGGVGISPYSVGGLLNGAKNLAGSAKRAMFGQSQGASKGLVGHGRDLGKKAITAWKNRGTGSAGNK